MRQDDGERIVADAALVDEMNADALHRRAKVREPVHGLLLTAPIEVTGPVIDQRAQFGAIRSECPTVVDLFDPASP